MPSAAMNGEQEREDALRSRHMRNDILVCAVLLFLNLVVIIPTSFKGVCMMFGGVCLQQDRSL